MSSFFFYFPLVLKTRILIELKNKYYYFFFTSKKTSKAFWITQPVLVLFSSNQMLHRMYLLRPQSSDIHTHRVAHIQSGV